MCSKKYYRYSSTKSAETFIKEGLIYFNSLDYYKNYPGENHAIKDEKEGSVEYDIPKDNIEEIIFDVHTIKKEDISSESVTITSKLKEPENFFIFCLSNKFDEKLYEKFEADTCIEIENIEEFTNRIRKVLPDNYKLNFNDVEYYDVTGTLTNAIMPLCLYKSKEYEYQCESRFWTYIPYLKDSKCKANGCNIGQIENIITHLKFQCLELRIGKIDDICKIIKT